MRRHKVVAAAIVAAAAYGSLIGPPSGIPMLRALDAEVTKLKEVAERGRRAQRLAAIDELRETDSTDSRQALRDLCEARDDQVAAAAMAALARCDESGCVDKFEDVYEDKKRRDGVRAVALMLWCEKKAGDGASWTDVKNYVETTAGSNKTLKDTAADLRVRPFGEAR